MGGAEKSPEPERNLKVGSGGGGVRELGRPAYML